MSVRNEIKAQIVRAVYTMQEVVDRLHEEYDWSDSVSNLSAKLQRESIRYKEVVELDDVLGYDIRCALPSRSTISLQRTSGIRRKSAAVCFPRKRRSLRFMYSGTGNWRLR